MQYITDIYQSQISSNSSMTNINKQHHSVSADSADLKVTHTHFSVLSNTEVMIKQSFAYVLVTLLVCKKISFN